MVNWYSSQEFMKDLYEKGTYAYGTLQSNRKQVRKDIKSVSPGQLLKKGESQYFTCALALTDSWADRKVIVICSNKHVPNFFSLGTRPLRFEFERFDCIFNCSKATLWVLSNTAECWKKWNSSRTQCLIKHLKMHNPGVYQARTINFATAVSPAKDDNIFTLVKTMDETEFCIISD